MTYKIIRHDKESDDIPEQIFNSYVDAYDLSEKIGLSDYGLVWLVFLKGVFVALVFERLLLH